MKERNSDSEKNQGRVMDFVLARQKLDSKKTERALDSIGSELNLDTSTDDFLYEKWDGRTLKNYYVEDNNSIALSINDICKILFILITNKKGIQNPHIVKKWDNSLYQLKRDEKGHLKEIPIKDYREFRSTLRAAGVAIDWKNGSKTFNLCPFEDFFFHFKNYVDEIEFISEWPRYPALPKATHRLPFVSPEPPFNKRLETFINKFCTDESSPANKIMLWGLVLGSFWGGAAGPGQRPIFCITGKKGDGRDESKDIGKSSLAEALLYLHRIEGKLTIIKDEVRMINGLIQNADRAIQLMDNMVEPPAESLLNALTTSSTYSGHRLNVGYQDRKAYSIPVITANDPRVESDTASRMFIIRLDRPPLSGDPDFLNNCYKYIDEHDFEMVAEAHWYLSQEPGNYTRHQINNRNLPFINDVLCKAPGFDFEAVAQHLKDSQEGVTTGDEHIGFQEYVFHRLWDYGPIKNCGNLYINKDEHKIIFRVGVMQDLYIEFKKPKQISKGVETGRQVARLCRKIGWTRIEKKTVAEFNGAVYIINEALPDNKQIFLKQAPSNTRGYVQPEFYRDPRRK